VPAMVCFSQGKKKITRPSDVSGSSRPICSGLNNTNIINVKALTNLCKVSYIKIKCHLMFY
jgi:hypothetical protein